MNPREPVWRPDPAGLHLTRMMSFMRHCERETGERYASYESLHRFSVEHVGRFWRCFLDWSGLVHGGDATRICTDDRIEHARFFPDLTLNYAAALLSVAAAPDDAPALCSRRGDGAAERLSRRELTARVEAGALALRALGMGSHSRAAMVACNDAQAVIATLSVAALGGAIAMSAPDMGADATIARFLPVAPELLFCHAKAAYPGAEAQHQAKLALIVRALPSLRAVILLDRDADTGAFGVPCHGLDRLTADRQDARFDWPLLPFDQPLFILSSSGTTGTPKSIVHGAGGTLIEHLKEHRLHCDFKAGDRLFFQTSTAWMMWAWSLSALASGVELVLYDGPVAAETLWRIAAEERVSVFGTSPTYLQMSERARLVPKQAFDLSALRAVLSTGSILFEQQQSWFGRAVKDLPVQSISGGTDIIGCFVMGNPILPAFAAEAQCQGLGFDLRALPAAGANSGSAGELVCASPFPSRPVGFLGDPGGTRFHDAYFAENPGYWTHGDLVAFTPEGGVVMQGRSDGTMNIRGIRVGPAEIYRILEAFPEISEALAVEQKADGEFGHARIVLLLVLRPGAVLDAALQARIRRTVGQQASGAHVPAVILAVDELPTTHTGKRSEKSARDAVNGLPVSNNGALRNPHCLAAIASHPGLTMPDDGPALRPSALVDAEGRIGEAALTDLWEEMIGIAPIGRDDDFFDIGADSLAALRLLLGIERDLGVTLPITFIYEAPTIARMAERLQAIERPAFSHLIPIKISGTATPLYIVHGIGGNVVELFRFGRLLDHDGPVFAIQAHGLDGRAEPLQSVEDMADTYLAAILARQAKGPYRLCGYSFGGLVAFEMARRLKSRGEEVHPVILLDTTVDERCWPAKGSLRVTMAARRQLREFIALRWRPAPHRVISRAQTLWTRLGRNAGRRSAAAIPTATPPELPPPLRLVHLSAIKALRRYRPRPYDGDVVLLRCAERHWLTVDAAPVWATLCGKLTVRDVTGGHNSMMRKPAVDTVARMVSLCLQGGCDEAPPGAERSAAGHSSPRPHRSNGEVERTLS